MRPIDADALVHDLIHNRSFYPVCARRAIEDAPTIDAKPVVHGEWEECDWVEYDGHGECIHYPKKGCVCTNCRNAFKKEFVISPRVDYCPHCGADMRGET